MKLPSLSLLLLAATGAMAAVLGIDFGEEYTKAALVAPGVPFEIILTSDSKRKDLSGLTFKKVGDEVERVYGNSAAALLTRFPEASAFYYKSLLGKSLDSDEANAFKSQQPGPVLVASNNNRSTIAYSINGETYPVEEILAMSLSKIKSGASELLEANQGAGYIKDVAVTVPAYFSVEQRRAIEDAVEIAGLNLISLVNEGVAVAVNFASTRQFDEKNQYHIIFDVGAGSTTATLVSFHHGEIVEENNRVPTSGTIIDVIGTSYNTDLAGHALTEFIRDILVQKFLAKNSNVKKAELVSDARAYSKLWREAEKAKIILSANTETTVSIESLYDDIDFSSKVSRTEFEALADQLKQDVTGPILDVLKNPLDDNTKPLDLSQIDSIILTGGSVRVPFIQAVLQDLTEGKVSLAKNVNGDEAAVMGTTLRGVGISKIFKSKHVIHVIDRSIWNYDLSLNGKQATALFKRGSQLGSTKTITLDVTDDFTLDVFENDERIVKYLGSGVEKTIDSVSTDAKKECIDDVMVEAEFTLTHSRTVELTRLSAKCSAKEKPTSKTSVEASTNTASSTEDSVSDQKSDEELGADAEASTVSDETSAEEATKVETAAEKASSTSAVEKPVKVLRKNITIKAKYDGPRPMGTASKQGSVSKLHLLTYADNQRVAKEEERNILEGAIYRVKEKAADSGDEQALAKISYFADWLEIDGQSASLKEIKEKRAELEKFSSSLESDAADVPDNVESDEASKTSVEPPEVTEDYSELGQSIKGIFEQYEELQKALYKAGLNPQEDQKKLGLDLSKLDNYAGDDLEPEQDIAQRIKDSIQLLEDTIKVGKSNDEDAKAQLAARIAERQKAIEEQQRVKERNDDKRFSAAKQMIEDAGKSKDVNDRMAGTAVDPNKPTDTPVEHDEL